MSTMLANMKLSPTAKECLDRLKELIMEENKLENEHLGSYEWNDEGSKKDLQ